MAKKDLSEVKTRRYIAQVSYTYQKNADPELNEEAFREKIIRLVKTLCTHDEDKFYIIFHDKDIDENGEPKSLHAHIYFEFKNSRFYSSLYKTLEISREKNLQVVKDKAKVCRYLTHRNEKDINEGKYQYEISEIISSKNSDYRLDICGKPKRADKKKSEQEEVDCCLEISYQICEQGLLLNQAKEKLFEEFDRLIAQQLWNRYKKQFEINRQEYIDKEFIRMSKGNRNHIGLYIEGSGGTGKTTLARFLAEERDEHGQHAPSTNKTRLDLGSGYDGQRTIVINEFDASCGISFRELFQILEPDAVTQLSSRFKDAHIINDLTIMTNSDDFIEWADAWFPKKKEYHQLMRRIPFFVKLLTKNSKTIAELYHYKATKDKGDKCKEAYEKVKTYNLGKTLDEEHLRKQAKKLLSDIRSLHQKKIKKATTSKSSTDQSTKRSSNSFMRNEQ